MTSILRDFKKPYQIKKKEIIFRNFFWVIILILLIFSSLFYFVVFSPVFQIREIKISNGQDFLVKDIENKIQNQIEQKILFFPSRSIFLANLKEINKIFLREFPLLRKVETRRDFPVTLIITVEERKPVAIFYHKEQKFFIDKYGIIFEEILDNEYFYLKIESLILTEELKLGNKILKEELVNQILEIKQQTKEINIPIIKALIVSDRRLNVKTLENWEIYINPKNNISQQIFNLGIVLEKEIPLDRRRDLKYIDLRFGNRIFYKYR